MSILATQVQRNGKWLKVVSHEGATVVVDEREDPAGGGNVLHFLNFYERKLQESVHHQVANAILLGEPLKKWADLQRQFVRGL